MSLYVDGYLIPIPRKNLATYRRMAKQAAKVWKEHGALEFRECAGDDLGAKGPAAFPKRAGAKAGETVIFSWVTYRSRAHRDRVNAKVMKDPRIARMMKLMEDPKKRPFEVKRMSFGGFKVLVDA
jgi:uncharacterized protein YbaA (DUF1428 family)